MAIVAFYAGFDRIGQAPMLPIPGYYHLHIDCALTVHSLCTDCALTVQLLHNNSTNGARIVPN
jgi:hypothetical protein